MSVYDVVVLGLGAMGSAASYHLARRGRRVLGLEQFGPAHDRGSSHGKSRIIREAYFEDPAYVPLVQRAYELWEELQAAAGRSLLVITGGLMIGPRNGELVTGALASAERHRLPYELIDASQIRDRVPVFRPDPETVAVAEPRAGVLFPEDCVRAQLAAASEAGADLRFSERVTDWQPSAAGVEVRTERGRYEAGHLVIAAGPWAPQALGGLPVPLKVERNVMYWFRPAARAEAFGPRRCPIWMWESARDAFIYYGFPAFGADGLKIAHHHSGEFCSPETIRRDVSVEEVERVRGMMARYLPDANGELLATVTCMYTNTPDGHFIIDRHPSHDAVTIACGFSGHGFKFAPVIGEILADLATDGRTRHTIDLFRLSRFTSSH
ncbi:MAG TPA: N-methyl-L-tryptophan oxidase [bacterium]|jgi:sarcosine oxidase